MTENMMRKHYVIFSSPGTFMAEQSEREIREWDARKAIAMAANIKERYGAVPYGFYFETRAVAPDSPDGEGGTIRGAEKTIRKSPMHFINGKVETLEQVKARATDRDQILIGNMECNGYSRIVTTKNGWSWCQPFTDGAINLDADGTVLEIASP